MNEDLFLIVGLGNPGPRFARHRHNVGFQVVDLLAQRHHLAFQRAEFRAAAASGTIGERRVLLAKPQTFMNLAGQAVAPLARFYKIPIPQILVLYDELDLPLGRLRFRSEGGSGGHNGMKSLTDSLGTQAFARLRIGIDRPPGKMDPAAYVLQDFSSDQEIEMAFCRPRAADGIEIWLREGIVAAMNKYNAV
ncbi:MAG: aminoacyl-tRNA hydrolase [Anaerolineae bacterium]|uniref:aminoacyl-tRNA hydrolase n=1 Tax=Candidatus Amarolinea dominans TaxID=3140696 RepID=UPI00313505D9|nr:aminoacyl-tRNA hydrolase [Anaerolineae bacterium]